MMRAGSSRLSPALRRRLATPFACAVAAGFALATLAAGAVPGVPSRSFADLSLEELLNETVTSVARREQRFDDVAAAVTVLSNDDLRRSGAGTVADALRLVPGMDVASINSSLWAISSRGFNSLFATKLLVLMDGRAVYSPHFAGVFWDQQQTFMDDVERIEVIRGPGASVWGANAVNGVVNVVTRSARDTVGGVLYAGSGNVDERAGGLRYGAAIGERSYYRVWATHQAHDDFQRVDGTNNLDAWDMTQGGFRVDHYTPTDAQLTWQGEASRSNLEHGASAGDNVNTLTRWTRPTVAGGQLEIQAYFDHTDRNEVSRARNRTDTYDVSAQHRLALGERHELIWGWGYRYVDAEIVQRNALHPVRNGTYQRSLYSAFVQDEFRLVPERLTLTAGLKVERNDYTGIEPQPSLRLLLKPAANQTVWAAVGRAARTPDAFEGLDTVAPVIGAPVTGPGGRVFVPVAVGNPDIDSETLWAYEAGYRVQLTNRVYVDLAGFYNCYDDLISTTHTPYRWVPGVPFGQMEILWENVFRANTYGAEVAVTVTPRDNWRLTPTATWFDQTVFGPKTPDGVVGVALPPPHLQLGLRSAWDLQPRLSFDAHLRYVSKIRNVPAYATADVRIAFRPHESLELAIGGRNLLEPRHLEQIPIAFATAGQVPRSFYAKATWRF